MFVRCRLIVVAAMLAFAGCAVSQHTSAYAPLPVPIESLQVAVDTSCGSPLTLPSASDSHVEQEISTAVAGELLPALQDAGIHATLIDSSGHAHGPLLRVRLLAVHHHYSFYNGSPIATPYVDLAISLHPNAGAPALWSEELDERWPGFYIDVQPRYNALVRHLAHTALEAVVPVGNTATAR